jgi:hypothetical protein
MAILDRIKKRVETDLDDSELQLLIDEANQDIISKLGPHANPGAPIEVLVEGWRKKIVLSRQIDVTEDIEITEYITGGGWGEESYVLATDDYRIWPSGYIIERLATGSYARWSWGDRVKFVYVPVNDGDQREEVIIKLVILSIEYEPAPGLRSKTLGDVTTSSADYQAERDKLIASLVPRGGLMMQ